MKCYNFKVADRNDVSPPESWVEDEDCELWIESSNWKRWSNNSFIEQVNRIHEQSGTIKWPSSVIVEFIFLL